MRGFREGERVGESGGTAKGVATVGLCLQMMRAVTAVEMRGHEGVLWSSPHEHMRRTLVSAQRRQGSGFMRRTALTRPSSTP